MRRLLLLGCLLALIPAEAAQGQVSLVPVGTFAAPTYVTAPLGDTSRLFVVQQSGTILVVRDGAASVFADLSDRVLAGGERGLLSMAFAPDYATTGLFYVDYTARSPTGALTVEEHRVDPSNPDRADPSYARILFQVPHDQQGNHNGGQLQFGPDGLLYVSTGDGGSAGDPAGNGQNLTSSTPPVVNMVNHDPRLAKLLKVDARSGAAPAIFAYGLRNPWRFSFDRVTGDLVIADVGQGAFEEVDFAPAPGNGAGANYGWNLFEGLHTYPGGAPAGAVAGTTLPVIEHTHADGWCSVAGGYVVRDPALPELAGTYVYGDLCKGRIYGARLPGGPDGDLGLPTVAGLASFGEDGCGRVYAVSNNGPIFRLASSGACAGAAPFLGQLPAVPVPGAAVPLATDRRGPVMTLRVAGRQHALRTGFIAARVSCDERCRLLGRGRVTLSRARGARERHPLSRARGANASAARAPVLRTRSVRVTLAPGRRRTLRLHLSRAVRAEIFRALRRPRRRAVVRVAITATDAARNARTATRRVRIVRG